MDPHGNPITVLTVDQHPDPQGLYPPQSTSTFLRSYHPALHLEHSLGAHHCGVEHRGPPPYGAQAHHAAFKRPKFHGRSFSRAACFSQYETMYQHYYFQGLTFPQQDGVSGPVGAGTMSGSGAHKGHHSRAFQQGLLYPTVVHMGPTTSSRIAENGSTSGLSCYHGHRSMCSGYLADCPGSDSSSSSSGQCHCSSSDSMLDCTEVSNQGVYGSCSTFRSSLSSDYDPYVYRSKSPCRGVAEAGACTSTPADEPSASPSLHQLPPGGDHTSSCSLEPRDNTSTTSASALEHERGKVQDDLGEHGVAACSCCYDVLLPVSSVKGRTQNAMGPWPLDAVTEQEQIFRAPKTTTLSTCALQQNRWASKYAHTDSDNCSAQGCCELNQRIPIIPEDTDCELGSVSETQSSLLPPSVKIEAEMWTGEQLEPREGVFTTRPRARGQAYTKEEETRALFHPPLSAKPSTSGNSTEASEGAVKI
ncbi:hypothetical protein WMY93_004316 [Mugilogobius chulae]|uniref:Uncharacterized protein n=1 Tax=Mugilogobius chulae TaxID=88201 RepID=A0AAW0PUK9_9GOBI